MKLVYSEHFQKRLKKRIDKNHLLRQKVEKQLKFLVKNSKHPSLQTHKLKGTRANQYAAWIEGDLRITFVLLEDTILLTDIITHNEY